MRRITAIAVLALALGACTPWPQFQWKPEKPYCYLIANQKVCRGEIVHPAIPFDE